MDFFDASHYYMDYSGQKLAETIFKYIMVAFGIVGFMVGYINEQLAHSIYIIGVGFVLAVVVTLPPWSIYRTDPIKWRKPRVEETTEETQKKTKKRR